MKCLAARDLLLGRTLKKKVEVQYQISGTCTIPVQASREGNASAATTPSMAAFFVFHYGLCVFTPTTMLPCLDSSNCRAMDFSGTRNGNGSNPGYDQKEIVLSNLCMFRRIGSLSRWFSMSIRPRVCGRYTTCDV